MTASTHHFALILSPPSHQNHDRLVPHLYATNLPAPLIALDRTKVLRLLHPPAVIRAAIAWV